VPKFTSAEKSQIKSIVAGLSINKIPDNEIIEQIERQTGKSISRVALNNCRRLIKRESLDWYQQLREDRFEYIHQFKERINEIMDLQKRAYKVIDDNPNKPQIILSALETLHRLNITLSNYYDVAPSIIPTSVKANDSIPIPSKDIIV